MKIYTGRGDKGETDLRTGDRVSKSSPRIEAYGSVDELNAFIGFSVSNLTESDSESEESGGSSEIKEGYEDVVGVLREVQNQLFIAQADLANPDKGDDDPKITQEDIDWLEEKCDEFDEELPDLQSFILPSGALSGSSLHLSRTVARRAERRVVELVNSDYVREEDNTETVLKYLNRLSDLLFILGRAINKREDVEEVSPSY